MVLAPRGPEDEAGWTSGAPVEDLGRDDAGPSSAGRAGSSGVGPATPLEVPAPDPATVLGAADPAAVWRAQVRTAARPLATAYLGRPPTPGEEERLVEALAVVRRSAASPAGAAGAAGAAERTRVEALVEADRSFREIVGVGVSEFVRELDPSQVEDLAPPQP